METGTARAGGLNPIEHAPFFWTAIHQRAGLVGASALPIVDPAVGLIALLARFTAESITTFADRSTVDDRALSTSRTGRGAARSFGDAEPVH